MQRIKIEEYRNFPIFLCEDDTAAFDNENWYEVGNVQFETCQECRLHIDIFRESFPEGK